MLKYLAQGFMLGIAYVAPIGMQNLYVINTAISKDRLRAYQVALITSFFDISLALACFYGMGILMDKSQILKSIILFIGSLAVIYIGIGLVRSKPEANKEVDVNKTLMQVVGTCFAVTWLNPQALIDGSLLLGGFKASLLPEASKMFILGVCIASVSWFTGVTTVVSIFRNNFDSKIIRGINIVCGSIVIYYGLKLGYSFIKLFA
ncbi:LysE family transporter [Wukongibacter baidiensis]|uniref:LysE/ArgO family amino acid transporter n=1 Tax=Wukongibacter baidiensis TaxID=1723361 RepID=UPI003D7F3B7A